MNKNNVTEFNGEMMGRVSTTLKKLEVISTTGENPKAINDKFSREIEGKFFDPKKACRIAYLEQNKVEAAEEEELNKLYSEEAKYKENPVIEGIAEHINDFFGTKTPIVSKIEKVIGKNKIRTMSFLPGALSTLKDPKGLTDSEYPSSILYASTDRYESEVNKEKVLSLSFVSVVFDDIANQYRTHVWVVTYKAKQIGAEKNEENNIPKLIDAMF